MSNDALKRMLIVTTAMTEVNLSSHYLKGADGGVPGGPSGLVRTPRLIENLTIGENFGVHGCEQGYFPCRGRWSLITAQGGRQFKKPSHDRDVLLPQYLDALKAAGFPSSSCKSFENTGLFPRFSGDYLFLGEDCRNKRHFDCEGFIAWVLVKAVGKDAGVWRQGVAWYQKGGGGRLKIFKAQGARYVAESDGEVINRNDILDGDIVIRKPNKWGGEHIAFACARGTAVLEASGKDRGVQRSTYQSNWTELARFIKL